MNKIATTIAYLLNNTAREIANRARQYSAQLVRSRTNKWVFIVGDYLVVIKIPKMLQKSIKNDNVLVSCTCDFWKYNGPDYHANNSGYSESVYSNLSEPRQRDPQGKYLICKHVYAALKNVLKNYDNRKTV